MENVWNRKRVISAKQKMLKVLRLISGLGKEDSNVSSPTRVFTVATSKSRSLLTNYSLLRNAELKKAHALMHARMWRRKTI